MPTATGRPPGPMAEAVENSLRYLEPDDIKAMVTYLRSIPAQTDGAPPPPAPPRPADALGARLFAEACAGCHLPNGSGRQSPWAALAGDQTASDPAGTNLLQVLVGGTQIETAQGLMFMHGFTAGYTDPELAGSRQLCHRPVRRPAGQRDGRTDPRGARRGRAGDNDDGPASLCRGGRSDRHHHRRRKLDADATAPARSLAGIGNARPSRGMRQCAVAATAIDEWRENHRPG